MRREGKRFTYVRMGIWLVVTCFTVKLNISVETFGELFGKAGCFLEIKLVKKYETRLFRLHGSSVLFLAKDNITIENIVRYSK